MKIYKDVKDGHALFVQPGTEIKTVSEWLDELGNAILMRVVFNNGCAVVQDNLAAYLIDKGFANRSPLVLPEGVVYAG